MIGTVRQYRGTDGYAILEMEDGHLVPLFNPDLFRCGLYEIAVGDKLRLSSGMMRTQIERVK
jgi:hypothetical protein